MSHRHTDITKDCRVCQVALQTWNRQLGCQVRQDSICHTQITFRIFEIDRIHLVRHSRRTDLTGFDLLFKILHRNILPEITAQIDQNRIDTFHPVKNSSHVVIVGNLCRPFLTAQSQHFIHKLIPESFPVIFRKSHMMRIEITGCSTELSRNRSRFQQLHLLFQTVNKHHHFFS